MELPNRVPPGHIPIATLAHIPIGFHLGTYPWCLVPLTTQAPQCTPSQGRLAQGQYELARHLLRAGGAGRMVCGVWCVWCELCLGAQGG